MPACNYCELKRIKKEAEKSHSHVYVRKSEDTGLDVFVVPEGEQLDSNPNGKHCVAWLMELPKECCC